MLKRSHTLIMHILDNQEFTIFSSVTDNTKTETLANVGSSWQNQDVYEGEKTTTCLLTVCRCSKYSYSVSGYGKLSSSSLWHFRPHTYPPRKPRRRAIKALATAIATTVSVENCDTGLSAALTSGPETCRLSILWNMN